MKYLFILGRNIELSIAEVLSYFESIENPILKHSIKKNVMFIEVKDPIEKNIVNKFGGVISIGEVVSSGNVDSITKELESKMLYYGTKNKLNYVLWDFSAPKGVPRETFEEVSTRGKDSYDEILSYLKKRFKDEQLKATKKNITGLIKLQTGKSVENVVGLVDEQYFIFEENGRNYFGRIIERCDYESLEKRDMEKPIRRESLSISPRLAKIMINLSQVKEGGKLVDAFCGIGTIIQEALIKGIKAIGVDLDSEAIQGAKQNLAWAGFSKNDYLLMSDNSKKVKIDSVDVLVTEPNLGEILKKTPLIEQAKKTLRDFEILMVGVLNNLKGNVSGRIVFTAPLIKAGGKRVSCDIDKILNRTKLALVEGFPIQEFREGQIVGRDIFVLEKG